VTRVVFLFLTATLLLSGCGLFSTRNPEAPNATQSSWSTPRVAMDVLTNMAATMKERDAVYYMRSFDTEHFQFEADPVSLSGNPSLSPWGYDRESRYINSLLSGGALPATSQATVVFTSITETPSADSTVLRAHYDLTANVTLTGAPHEVAGTAEFVMRIGGDGYLQIFRWRDFRTEGQSTWSDFKSALLP
jgi:hypothetical protein